mmetsp:Transcript_13822/g.26990  ORF Transcript_13822/g.26990 Transcript_13822/m.26990 type:complete len:121 (-) Transcript_13822:682-1044(-)
MAKKNIDVSFIKVIDSHESWESNVLQNMGVLLIIDVYSTCWGPCKMLDNHFSNTFYEMAEDHALTFCRADCEKVPELSKEFQGNAMPNFLFYLDGNRKELVTGPNMPAILDLIAQLAPKK